ncbi:uncharacterized protein BBA_10285 [Beauveria bassiana ARSEF 2860]|uniref:Uncharacterized protein n=1 Tax=Beauveria bassiana (strain ARSEF 2860) TaxID=655819 RepID=J4VQ04_BEAB2|nr:uncharacterized protein BBA_10285 [Beauveria bassiana ARSEF 2860]EJP60765.1 hypothetical protein BBA_10285 [Beauveria bassiana ARSEF 2860]
MNAPSSVSQLESIITNLETCVAALHNTPFTHARDGPGDLTVLGTRVANVGTAIQKKAGSYRPPCRPEVWEASKNLRTQTQSAIEALIRDQALKQSSGFRRNIVLIFAGPRFSNFDSAQMKARKMATRIRCERLRQLEPDQLVVWALSYKSTSWAVGSMGTEMFDCLTEAVHFNAPRWPTAVGEVLYKLQETELRQSVEYSEFLRGEMRQKLRHKGRINNVKSSVDCRQ